MRLVATGFSLRCFSAVEFEVSASCGDRQLHKVQPEASGEGVLVQGLVPGRAVPTQHPEIASNSWAVLAVPASVGLGKPRPADSHKACMRPFTPPGKAARREDKGAYKPYDYQPGAVYQGPKMPGQPEPPTNWMLSPDAGSAQPFPEPILEPALLPPTPQAAPYEVDGRRNWLKPQIQRR